MAEFFEVLRREFVYIWYYFEIQFRQICRYWILGMLIGSFISVFAKDRIHRLFAGMRDKKWGIFGIVPACLLGIASPLCMYGTIPIAASFRKQGMREDWLAAFMMASILLNPQLIIYSAALGTTALIVRIVSCFFCGIAAGVLVFVFYRDRDFFDFSGFEVKASRDTHPNLLIRYLLNVLRNVRATGLYFIFGILLSALFQRYVPGGLMRDDPAASGVAHERDESRVGLGIHAHRARHEDHEPRGTQDRDGNEALSPVYGLYHAVFAIVRNVCEYHSVKSGGTFIILRGEV